MELFDYNYDGEVDEYCNFNNYGEMFIGIYDYVVCLEVDIQGCLYYVWGNMGVECVSVDGMQYQIIVIGL